MPNQKNQHFVPRVYFKPFSLNRDGRAINLINIEQEIAIQNASVSGQCSKSYFYGEDATTEGMLAFFEGHYGQIFRTIESRDHLSKKYDDILRIFTLLQFARTEVASKLAADLISGVQDLTYVGDWSNHRPSPMPDHVVKLMALSHALESREYFQDLKMCVFTNETQVDLITSDNPVIATNRWSWQKHQDHRCGMASSGLIICLPLSPRMLVCYFDRGTYSCPGSHPVYRTLDDRRDVYVLNELQILNADSNVYFSDWQDRDALALQVTATKDHRPAERILFKVFIEDEKGTDGFHGRAKYRLATSDEVAQPMPKLVMHSRVYPVPSRWISGLKIRAKPVVFTNGSAAGYVRNPAWLTSERS